MQGIVDQHTNPRFNGGLVRFQLKDGAVIQASPDECWEVMEALQTYLRAQGAQFDPPLTRVVRAHNQEFNVVVSDHIDFWRAVDAGVWEPLTLRVLDTFLTPETIYIDVGCWIGPTALYAASLAKNTYAFEPDPIAYAELGRNVAANSNRPWSSRLSIRNMAIATKCGTMKLGSRAGGGDSTSSVLFGDRKTSWDVKAITLQRFLEDEAIVGQRMFLKVDIEGGEYDVIPSVSDVLARCEGLHLSIHPQFLMESLKEVGGAGLFGAVIRRLRFAWRHFQLVRSLPFRHVYHSGGRSLNLMTHIRRALVNGTFPTEIIATNADWPAQLS